MSAAWGKSFLRVRTEFEDKVHATLTDSLGVTPVFTLGAAVTYQKPSFTHFDVHVALVQYTSQTLLVDF